MMTLHRHPSRARRRPALLLASILGACSSATPAPADGPTVPDAGIAAQDPDAGAAPTDAGPAAVDAGPEPVDPRVLRARDRLVGRFDSADQAAGDADFLAVQLRVCEVALPALGPAVLYVEQAIMTSLDRPYRQRLYVLSPGPGPMDVTSTVYTLAAPSASIGRCDAAAPPSLTVDDAVLRAGCEVFLTELADGRFEGTTWGERCPSDLNGASYATSDVRLYPDRVESWDRGYDAADRQVWGSTAGAYVFLRR
jgi:CpeT protein